jgi:hypothetical protein
MDEYILDGGQMDESLMETYEQALNGQGAATRMRQMERQNRIMAG